MISGFLISYDSHQVFSCRTFSDSARKFNVLGIQQVAIGGLDKQLLSNFWVNTMGINKVGDYKSEVNH